MFGFGKKDNKKQEINIYAPLSGVAIAIDDEQVTDQVFRDKVMGDGVAILPSDGSICAPVAGTLSMIADTKHAFGFMVGDDVEILVHVGLETVSLKGEPFEVVATVNSTVKPGDVIAKVDLDMLKQKNVDSVCPVVVCAGVDDKNVSVHLGDVVAGQTEIITIK